MSTDQWARWLLHRRDGDSATLRAHHSPALAAFRDGVLDRATLRPDDVLLDVGCGTGLVGFGALERLGPDGRVIFSDVSQDLLDECRRTAAGDGRCSFVRAAAEDLTGIADASVDVVTTRSVLIYCARKADAFAEFFRVLRPGGRLAIFEPINGFRLRHRPHDIFGLAGSPVDDLLARVAAVFTGVAATAGSAPTGSAATADSASTGGDAMADFAATGGDPMVADSVSTGGDPMVDFASTGGDPMVDFDERDLLGWAVDAGFAAVELDYRAQLDVPAEPMPAWSQLKHTAPNPLAPTYAEAMEAALDEEERARLDAYLSAPDRPTRRTMAVAYLRATVPV